MTTYLRLLEFTKSEIWRVPIYVLLIILHTIFRVLNFTALIPVLQLLFDTSSEIRDVEKLPVFSLSDEFLIETFYYYFGNIIIEEGRLQALYFICIILLCTVFLSNIFQYLAALVQARIRINSVSNLRNAVFNKLTSLSLGFFTSSRKGDLMSRINTDALQVEFAIVNTLKVLFREPFLIAGFFFALFKISPDMTLYTLLLIPVSALIISFIAKRLKRRAIKAQQSMGRLSVLVDEAITGMKIIKSFTARSYVLKAFDMEIRKYARHNFRMATKNNLSAPISEFLGVVFLSVLLIIGGSRVLDESAVLSASEFIVFLVLFSQVLSPAKAVSNAFSNIQRGLAAGDRLFEIMDQKINLIESENAIHISGFKQELVFKEVSFAYEEQPVLKGINFKLRKGEVVALVGPSGGGKSTIADLISRFYDPTSGSIVLDGNNLKDLNLSSLRSQIGIVTQDSILFNDTVFNNIAFGLTDASIDEVREAATIAHAHDFISKMESGYETMVGEGGAKLSGGQKQRISIARAMLKNPPILILDEATSALDTESEKLVQEAILQLMKNRTVLVIAHRLSTIQHADKILFISDGEIKETGTHSELMQQDGGYKKLIDLQAVS